MSQRCHLRPKVDRKFEPNNGVEISSSCIFGSISTDFRSNALFLHKLVNSIDDAVPTTY
jgi:hypothetical protein